MGIPFRVVKSSYRESPIKNIPPSRLVLVHAKGKAEKARAPKNTRCILAADTVVVYRNHILGKPKNWSDAVRMLSMLSGKWHSVYTGVVLVDRKQNKIFKGVNQTKVRIKKLSEDEIKTYVKKINALDKAGAYAIQAKPSIVSRIRGSYSNGVGLPKERVRQLLRNL